MRPFDLKVRTIRQNEPITNHKYDEISRWQPIRSQGEPTIASKIQVKCTRMKILFLYELFSMKILRVQCTYNRKSGNCGSHMGKYRTASGGFYALYVRRSG